MQRQEDRPAAWPEADTWPQADRDDSWRWDSALAAIAPDEFDLFCIDIFDTLILRRWGPPETVFERVAQDARTAGLLDPSMTDDAFVIVRRQAEARARAWARTQGHSETGLADIYRALEVPGIDAAALERLERTVERRAAVANPNLVALLCDLRRRRKPVALVSDMYLGGTELEDLLGSVGILPGRDYDRLYVSCDHGASKAGGALFRVVLADHPGVPPSRILHIGDDPVTDKAGALAAGIHSVHYTQPGRSKEMLRRESLLGNASRGPLTLLRTLAGRRRTEQEDDAFWHHYGASVLGPIAVHYANWVLRHAAARGIRRIAPLMREGELLGQLIAREAERLGMDVDARPLAVSRAALYLPSLTRFDEAEFRSLGSEIYLTLRDVMVMFGLDDLPHALTGHADRPLVDLLGAEFGEGADAYQAARSYLLAEGTKDRILAKARQARRNLVSYVETELADAGPVALVDIGAKGSMFERLSRMPELGERYDFHGYLFYATPDALHRMANGLRVQVHMPLAAAALERAKVVYRSPQFFELLLNGEAATTAGYRRDAEGRAVPVFLHMDIDAAQQRALRACHAGIFSYYDQWAALAERNDDGSGGAWEVDPAVLLGILHRAVHLPTHEEASRIGRLVFDVNNGSPVRLPLCNNDARRVLAELCAAAPPPLWLSLALQTRPSELPWPQGTMALEQPGHIEEMIEGAQGGFGHRTISRQLVHMARRARVSRFILCAAGGMGGMGPTLLDVAHEAGLECVGYADLLVVGDGVFRQAELGLADAARQSCRDIIVVSVGYGPAIIDALKTNGKGDGRPLRCWWYDGTRFRTTRLLHGTEEDIA